MEVNGYKGYGLSTGIDFSGDHGKSCVNALADINSETDCHHAPLK